MSQQNAERRPVYRRLRRRAPNAAEVAPTDVAMSDATDVGDVAPTGGAGPSLAAGGAGERGTKRRHGEIQSTGVEVGQMPPRQILFDGSGYMKFLVERRHLVQKENDSLIRSLLSDVGSAIDELKKNLEINRHSFSASLESAYQECAQKLAEEKANADQHFEELVKGKASHDQAFNDAFTKLTEERERLVEQYDYSRKSEESLALSFASKIDQLGQSLNKRDQDENVSAKLVVDAGKLAPGLWAEPSTIP